MLLAAHDAASQFLNTPAVEQLQGGDKGLDRTLDHSVAKPNDEVKIDEGSDGPDLSFLQPATKPGSIGSLGHYEILQVLGQGAFGVVFRAFDEKLHRQVAVRESAFSVKPGPSPPSNTKTSSRFTASKNSRCFIW